MSAVIERINDYDPPFFWKGPDFQDRPDPPHWWSWTSPATLFTPIGHLGFRPDSVEWSSFIKYKWLQESAHDRAEFERIAGQLAKVVGATLAFISPDGGPGDFAIDILEHGGTVRDVIAAAGRSGTEPAPFPSEPFRQSTYYTLHFT